MSTNLDRKIAALLARADACAIGSDSLAAGLAGALRIVLQEQEDCEAANADLRAKIARIEGTER